MQVSVFESHELSGVQVATPQASPGLALATHSAPLQVPVEQVENPGDPGNGAQGKSGRPASAHTPPASHTVQGTQPSGASAQLCPRARRMVQVPARQNSVPGQSLSTWHGPPGARG